MASKYRKSGYHPIRKLKVILAGLQIAIATEFSVAYKVILSVVVLVIAVIFSQWPDLIFIFLVTGLMLIAELFNSAIEGLCDFLEQQYDEKIRAIKDISAAAVGISILIWAVALIFESHHLWSLLI
ncbi:diacylglycerol kinase [Planktothrix mougeotii]|uniref:Diacylglycerol kinase n=1 Tax=Planktothrix mougeotii LEGE 06226 TaxID=1828728 RepID=A0ABR9U7D8_9CYAN|nr:diacylglycerol kinase [Planktothrix mougeotii]MBE9142374.1 diacylglycerol kinase [Planktothrix mougeotii LEGE 06226]